MEKEVKWLATPSPKRCTTITLLTGLMDLGAKQDPDHS